MPEDTALNSMKALADLLSGHAKPVIEVDRMVPSATYDFDYRLVIIATAFQIHAKRFDGKLRRIATARLKLMQFVAQRPWLLQTVREWGDSQFDAQKSLLVEQRLRRGYVGDTVFDKMIDFAVAQGALERGPSHLIEGARFSILAALAEAAENLGLFKSERNVIEEFKSITITNLMLEGA